MEDWIWSLIVVSTICFSAILLLHQILNKKSRKLPPGPRGWPIIGNLFDLGTSPHTALANLHGKHGPVIHLRLGAMKTVVIQSAEAAKELFKNHDISFAGRTVTETMRAHNYHHGSMAVAQYGPYWRMLRRICTAEIFSNKRINETAFLRREKVDDMIRWIEEEAQVEGDNGVQVAHSIFLMTFNLLGNLFFSRDLLDPQSKEGFEFFSTMDRIIKLTGDHNLADYFPLLKWLDPQGMRMKAEQEMERAMNIVCGFMQKRVHKQELSGNKRRKDFLDVLMEFEGDGNEEPRKISDKNIVILMLEMFFAGTETTSSTVEWVMTELLRNPKSMSKVCTELTQVVGSNKKFEESDIDNLQYLPAVVKETLRLHPPTPFLIPRRAVNDNFFMGYLIPKDTQVFVNAWAIGRDPNSWDDPLSFKPERFLGSDIDYRGQHFELIPFGAGRRICVGLPLAHQVVHFVLGSLLHYFEWELEHGLSPETIDMNDRIGITLRKATPLKAIPRKRSMY